MYFSADHPWLLVSLVLTLSALATPAFAHTQPSRTPASQPTSFLTAQTHRFQGTLRLAKRIKSYKEMNLRHVPTNALRDDLRKLNRTLLNYMALNRPHLAPVGTPIALIIIGAIGLQVGASLLLISALGNSLSGTFLQTFLIAGFITLGVGIAGLASGIPWLIFQIRKRKESPHYKKIIQLKHIKKAIILELRRNRSFRRDRYSLHLPYVHGKGVTFSF